MEAKTIFYIVGGIFYLIYTYYKNKSESENKPDYKTTKPVVKTPFDEVIEQMRKMTEPISDPQPVVQQKTEEKNQSRNKQQVFKGKEILVNEKYAANFEEGSSAYKTHQGNFFEEGGNAIIAIEDIKTEQEEARQSFDFNLREAVIQSIVLERKF
jgi:hypothetical protein